MLLCENCNFFKIHSIWECEINKELRESEEMRTFFKNFYPILDPLNPRGALYGGRCSTISGWYKARLGERILYLDINSCKSCFCFLLLYVIDKYYYCYSVFSVSIHLQVW